MGPSPAQCPNQIKPKHHGVKTPKDQSQSHHRPPPGAANVSAGLTRGDVSESVQLLQAHLNLRWNSHRVETTALDPPAVMSDAHPVKSFCSVCVQMLEAVWRT